MKNRIETMVEISVERHTGVDPNTSTEIVMVFSLLLVYANGFSGIDNDLYCRCGWPKSILIVSNECKLDIVYVYYILPISSHNLTFQ